jgi:hypothetical protein
MSILSGAMKIRQIHEKLMSHHHPAFEWYEFDALVVGDQYASIVEWKGLWIWLLSKHWDNLWNVRPFESCILRSGGSTCDDERSDQICRKSIVGQVSKQELWDWEKPVFADMVGVRDFIKKWLLWDSNRFFLDEKLSRASSLALKNLSIVTDQFLRGFEKRTMIGSPFSCVRRKYINRTCVCLRSRIWTTKGGWDNRQNSLFQFWWRLNCDKWFCKTSENSGNRSVKCPRLNKLTKFTFEASFLNTYDDRKSQPWFWYSVMLGLSQRARWTRPINLL